MLEISRKNIYTDGLKIFRSQELLPVSLETRVQYGGGEITSSRKFDWMRLDSALKMSSPIYLGPKNLDTILMHWMSVKLADNFQIREHSWPCLFHISIIIDNVDFASLALQVASVSYYFSYIVAVSFIDGGNHRPVASHWPVLSHTVVSSTLRLKRGSHSQLEWWYKHNFNSIGTNKRI